MCVVFVRVVLSFCLFNPVRQTENDRKRIIQGQRDTTRGDRQSQRKRNRQTGTERDQRQRDRETDKVILFL